MLIGTWYWHCVLGPVLLASVDNINYITIIIITAITAITNTITITITIAITITITIIITVSEVIPVSVKKRYFSASLCPATQQ